MRHLKTTLTVIGAATVLLLAGNTLALAATGQALILGRSNNAGAMTSLTRTTNGPVLKLNPHAVTNAPLSVTGKGRVANLNADRVDGFEAAALRSRAYVFTRQVAVPVSSLALPAPVPAGRYLVSYSAYLVGATNADVGCYVARENPTVYVGESRFHSGAETPGVSGSGFITLAAGQSVRLSCGAGTPFTTYTNEPVQFVLTPVDSATTSASTNATRTSAGRQQTR